MTCAPWTSITSRRRVSSSQCFSPKTTRLLRFKHITHNLRSKGNRLRQKQLKKKERKHKYQVQLLKEASRALSTDAQTLILSQIKLRNVSKYRRRYDDRLKDFALSIYYHSLKAYRFLRKSLCLSTIRTLRSYQQTFHIYPCVNMQVLNMLKAKFLTYAVEDKVVSLVFDEIHLYNEVYYDPHMDQFRGVADDGDTRQPECATSALTCMIKWINKNAKQTLGYWFLSSAGNSDKTQNIIQKTVAKVWEMGLIPKVIVFDQGPRNVGLLKILNITPQKPYFYYKSEKIFIIFDPPHLLKSVRNNFNKSDIEYNGKIASWGDIYKMFALNSKRPLNLVPKLNNRRFELTHFTKMKVSLAA
ncbi:uncharacterized protein LOC128882547 [Hylaeus volcanicus]|uniref:uncharacterized protein LOC128882547 n=1 Tax=Hylaeus volcanicus TaxID=313075 RepID=UPI0023B87B7D|nr:uncharacterized protein LOC128882547 [Hylaeus volcanicus]